MRVVVRTFLKNAENKYLMVRHKGKNYRSLPGGWLKEWENLNKAVKRECKEELNLKINVLWDKFGLELDYIKEYSKPICSYKIEYEDQKRWKIKRIEHIFLSEIVSWEIKIQKDEIDEYKFFSKDELWNLENTHAQVKEILKKLD